MFQRRIHQLERLANSRHQCRICSFVRLDFREAVRAGVARRSSESRPRSFSEGREPQRVKTQQLLRANASASILRAKANCAIWAILKTDVHYELENVCEAYGE